jgi:hypothetical protein
MKKPCKIKQVISSIESGQSERSACESAGINRSTFRSAVLKLKVVDQYARALEALAQNQVELLEEAIADMRSGKIDAAMARVEIDARKWFASKFLPKRYGDKIAQEISGPDGGAIKTETLALTPDQESSLAQVIEDARARVRK